LSIEKYTNDDDINNNDFEQQFNNTAIIDNVQQRCTLYRIVTTGRIPSTKYNKIKNYEQ